MGRTSGIPCTPARGPGYLARATVFGTQFRENFRAVLNGPSQPLGADAQVGTARRVRPLEAPPQPGPKPSGKRRLEVARAIVHNPQLVLLDEPFVGIDPITVGELKNMILRLKEQGIGVLITDHNVREAMPIIDRAYLIYDGQILFEGEAKQLLEDPKARELYLGKDFKI